MAGIQDVPPDVLAGSLGSLSVFDVDALSRTNSEVRRVVNRPRFWRQYVAARWGNRFKELGGPLMAQDPARTMAQPKRRTTGWSLDYKWAAIAMEVAASAFSQFMFQLPETPKRVRITLNQLFKTVNIQFKGDTYIDYIKYINLAFPIALWEPFTEPRDMSTTWYARKYMALSRDEILEAARTHLLRMVYSMLRAGFLLETPDKRLINEPIGLPMAIEPVTLGGCSVPTVTAGVAWLSGAWSSATPSTAAGQWTTGRPSESAPLCA
jgi:hypothetical protein